MVEVTHIWTFRSVQQFVHFHVVPSHLTSFCMPSSWTSLSVSCAMFSNFACGSCVWHVHVSQFNVLHCCDFVDCVLGGELSPVAVSFFSFCFFGIGMSRYWLGGSCFVWWVMTPLLAPKNPIYNCTFVVQSSWVLYYAHLSLNLSFSIFSSLW